MAVTWAQYAIWYFSEPKEHKNQRNAIIMVSNDEKWYGFPISCTLFVLRERVNLLVLRSKITENTNWSNAKFDLLDEQLKADIKLVNEIKQTKDVQHVQVIWTVTEKCHMIKVK